MNNTLTFLECGIFLLLSFIHFNWALGGKFGFENAIPKNDNGERIMNPAKFDSALVGFGLLIFAFYFLAISDIVNITLPRPVRKYGGWLIVLIFFLRAIGEFNYLGFFKKPRNTNFAKMDTQFYAPLCLILSLIGFYLIY